VIIGNDIRSYIFYKIKPQLNSSPIYCLVWGFLLELIMKEVWKPVHDNPEYHVSNLGRIKSFKVDKDKGKIMSQSSTRGYKIIKLSYNGQIKTRYLHRLVAKSFIPNPKNKPQIHHKDNNPSNNNVNNLMWVTQKENNNFSKYRGKHARNRKLTKEDVLLIRLYDRENKYRHSELAKMFDCTHENIRRVCNRITWTHI